MEKEPKEIDAFMMWVHQFTISVDELGCWVGIFVTLSLLAFALNGFYHIGKCLSVGCDYAECKQYLEFVLGGLAGCERLR